MRTHALALTIALAALPLLGCPKKGSDAADGGATTSSSAKPPAPADAPTSCTVTLTGKVIGSGTDQAVEFKMKNTGSHVLRFCQINVFGYDKSGAVGGRGALSENHELKPGEEFTSDYGVTVKDDKSNNVANTPGLSFVVAVSSVMFSDNSEWDDNKFDFTKGPGPNGGVALASAASASASASASAAPAAAPPGAAPHGTAIAPHVPPPPPGRPRPPPPRPR